MRRLLIVGFACALVAAPSAGAVPSPIDAYSDFAAHGRLTKHYPNSVLQQIINDASLNQYGDPLLMMRLRRAARLQLAGAPVISAASTTTQSQSGGATTEVTPGSTRPTTTGSVVDTTPTSTAQPANSAGNGTQGGGGGGGASDSQPLVRTRTVVLGAVLLVLAAAGMRYATRARRST